MKSKINDILIHHLSTQQPQVIVTYHPSDHVALMRQAQWLDPSRSLIHELKGWEILPYDSTPPAHHIIANRLQALHHLLQGSPKITIIPYQALCQKTVPPAFIHSHTFKIEAKQAYAMKAFKRQLHLSNYQSVDLVTEPGTYAVRGSLIDVFINGHPLPVRIDFFDDFIDEIRVFSPKSQQSIEKISGLNCLPGAEYTLEEDAIAHFRSHWRTLIGDIDHPLYKKVSQGQSQPELFHYFSLFHETSSSIFDYLPANTCIHHLGHDQDAVITHYHDMITSRHEDAQYQLDYPPLDPQNLYLDADTIQSRCAEYSQQHHHSLSVIPCRTIDEVLAHYPDRKIIFDVATQARKANLIQQLSDKGINWIETSSWEDTNTTSAAVVLTKAQLVKGIVTDSMAIITESQLFGPSTQTQTKEEALPQKTKSTSFNPGDYVVHQDHGIGIYKGLESLSVNQSSQEFITLTYHGQDKLYVPVTQLSLIEPYQGLQTELVELDSLGTGKWLKRKEKAHKKIEDIAAKLLVTYAARKQKKGISHTLDTEQLAAFNAQCDFDLTQDQSKATQEILRDMQDTIPMERLLCADVGFGKTEVAMRAAFVSANGGHQVIILVPTTLLAEQHYRSFTERFSNFPLEVSLLTRHQTTKARHHALSSWDQGKIDILITTHLILNQSIKTDSLGLLIIDEEHRFGVKQKEKIKSLKPEVDILMLTATPIPRTLHMSLTGIKDMSLIQTPPKARMPVVSTVSRYHHAMIQEALSREIMRGGQAFYLYNKVASIQQCASDLQALLPTARIKIIHGQMHEHESDKVMKAFLTHDFDILVCTTIIESGIDIPNANTIVIERADKLGLAQLHQIRGRVGRSDKQAYAYFLTPREGEVSLQSQRRLRAIEKASSLGAGYQIATEDLDIRGTGELLGDEQSGHAAVIGLNLYHQLLEEAIQLKDEPKRVQTQIEMPFTTMIPVDYIPSPLIRLELYREIQACDNYDQILSIRETIHDRFGRLPQPCLDLLKIKDYQLKLGQLGIIKVKASTKLMVMSLQKDAPINATGLIQLIQKESNRFSLVKQTELHCRIEGDNLNLDIMAVIDRVMSQLKME